MDSDNGLVDFSDEQAAAPADVVEDAFQFQPASTSDNGHEDRSALSDFASEPEMETAGTDEGSDQSDRAWGTSESFSRRNLLETIPVQYPLDDSAYEGEDPLGEEPEESEGDWRSSSVDHHGEEVPLEDQPWIELHKFTFLAQTLPAGSNGLGITSVDLKETFKFSRWPFLFVTPRAGFHFLNAPAAIDLPSELYDFSFDTTAYLPINDRWTVQLTATPSLFSDLKASKNAFRMVGRGLVYYRWSQELQLAGGFIYLGRKDITALPAAGLIWTPNDDVKFDIMFPRPRIGYRYSHNEVRERWVYATGELGGGSWAVQRAGGNDDVATYRDYQLLLGIENKAPSAVSWQFEAGYAFSRKLEYLSSPVVTEFPSCAVLRLILSY